MCFRLNTTSTTSWLVQLVAQSVGNSVSPLLVSQVFWGKTDPPPNPLPPGMFLRHFRVRQLKKHTCRFCCTPLLHNGTLTSIAGLCLKHSWPTWLGQPHTLGWAKLVQHDGLYPERPSQSPYHNQDRNAETQHVRPPCAALASGFRSEAAN